MLFSPTELLNPRRHFTKPLRGVVVDNNDPLQQRRVKCTISPYIVGDVADLPWCTCHQAQSSGGSSTIGFTHIPEIGTEVTVEFPYGYYFPVYTGYWQTGSTVQSDFAEDYPNSWGWTDGTGNRFKVNKAQEYLELVHSSGTYLRITKEGNLEEYVAKDRIRKVAGNVTEIIEGSSNRMVKGSDVDQVIGTKNILVGSTFNQDAADINLNGSGPAVSRIGDTTTPNDGPGHTHDLVEGAPHVNAGEGGAPTIAMVNGDPILIPSDPYSPSNTSPVITQHGEGIILYDTRPAEIGGVDQLLTQTPIEYEPQDQGTSPAVPLTCNAYTHPNYDHQLSTNFKLSSLSVRATFPHAVQAQNGLTEPQIVCNLQALCENVLEPLLVQYPGFAINSGFRKRQNGRSQHEKGQASDVQWSGVSYDDLFNRAKWVRDNIKFDQFIFEHGREYKEASGRTVSTVWFHFSWNSTGNRGKVTTMHNGKYRTGLVKLY